MGKLSRALNRTSKDYNDGKKTQRNPNFARKPREFKKRVPQNEIRVPVEAENDAGTQEVKKTEIVKMVDLVKLSEKDLARDDIPYVFKKLPETVEKIEKLFGKHTDGKKVEKDISSQSIILKRLREYYHPDGVAYADREE